MIKKLILILFLTFCVFNSYGQYVDFGTDPAYLKWNKIKTEHYKIIYPQEYSEWAQHYAIILEKSFPSTINTLKSKRKISRYPVILHPHSVINNGMVAWAPKRMELLPINGTDESFQLTNRHLALHEQRHVIQMQFLNRKISFLKYLLGEQAVGLPSLFTPKWFFEGDAVTAETALSSSGRGREADFLMAYRAQYSTNKNYSFDKWMMGSYKHFTPSYYGLGYAVSAYGRAEYGTEVWPKVLRPWGFFSRRVKKVTGTNLRTVVKNTFSDLDKEWKSFENDNVFDDEPLITNNNKEYVNYKSPIKTDKGIVAIKWSQSDVNSLVLIENGKEKHLAYLGNINSKLVYNGDFVYWTVHKSSLRREHKNYSNIVAYNLRQNKRLDVTSKTRYFNPAINKEGNIAVYEPESNGNNNIVIVNPSTGKLINKYSVINNGEVKDIVFDNNDNLIASVVTDKGNYLMQLNTELGEWYGVLRSVRTNISKLRSHDNYVTFQSGYSGINNIYAINTLDLSVEKWTNTRFGATDAYVTSDSIYYSSYTDKGYKLVQRNIDELSKSKREFNSPYKFSLAERISAQEEFNIDTITYIGGAPYEETRYRKGGNLFKIHSWMPLHIKKNDLHMQIADDIDVNFGVTVLSQNNLNTLTSSASYYIDREGYSHGELFFKYSGIFPVIQATLDFGGKNYDIVFNNDLGLSRTSPDRTALNLDLKTYLPFSFNKNATIHGLQPFFNYTFTSAKVQENPFTSNLNNFKYARYGLYYFLYKQVAVKDIYPKYGLQIWASGMGDLSSKQNYSRLYSIETKFYLPGLFKNHSFRIDAEYQRQDLDDAILILPKRILSDIRGFGYLNLFSEDAFNLKFDYAFTLANPDFSVGSLIYLKRIRTNLFFDYNNGSNVVYNEGIKLNNKTLEAHSYGAEFLFDTHFFRLQIAPISIGARVGYTSKKSAFGDFMIGLKF